MEDQIKALQQETLFLTQRVIALENALNAQKPVDFPPLEARVKTLEDARVAQRALNTTFATKTEPKKSVFNIFKK